MREGHRQAWLMMRGPGFGRQPAETMMRAAVGDHGRRRGIHAALVRAALRDDHLQRRMIERPCFLLPWLCRMQGKKRGSENVYMLQRGKDAAAYTAKVTATSWIEKAKD